MIDLQQLNPQQKIAVETTEGQLLILAGAGSGKTKTLMHRIAYIIDQELAAPNQLLVVTFTNKAAGEMKERIATLLDESGQSFSGIPWMGTFHSMCVKMLRREGKLIGYNSSFTIYDTQDQLSIIKDVMKELDINPKEVKPQAISKYISNAKNQLVQPQEYVDYAQGYFQELVAQIYPEYQQRLQDNNAMDFDDLIMKTVLLFESEEQILANYQQQFKYVMVDEYQDTNHAQYKLVNMLAAGYRNICCVGDDDQSIYAFRGATIRNILNFERDYPEAKVTKLEQNYRSTQKILEASHQVVSKNQNRKDKKLWTDNNDGENIVVYEAQNEHDEGRWITSQIAKLKRKGASLSEIAVLYRTNAQSRALEEQFLQAAIDYRVVGGTKFYDRKEIRDVIAYLRVLNNPQDNTSLMRIINMPRRGIGAKTASNLISEATARDLSVMDFLVNYQDEIANKSVQRFSKLIGYMQRQSQAINIVELINELLERSGYYQMLQDGTQENESRLENIRELISVATKFSALEPAASLAAFLEEVSLFEAAAEDDDSDKVTLMTIHAAKGLEFKYLFVTGVEEGLFPHSRVYTNPKELEEERRLAYVAITRAKLRLHITHAESRLFFGKPQSNLISRFVEDISDDLLDKRSYRLGDFADGAINDSQQQQNASSWAEVGIGDRIRHDYFGIGVVTDIEDDKAVVNFGPVYGVKEIVLEFAPIAKV